MDWSIGNVKKVACPLLWVLLMILPQPKAELWVSCELFKLVVVVEKMSVHALVYEYCEVQANQEGRPRFHWDFVEIVAIRAPIMPEIGHAGIWLEGG